MKNKIMLTGATGFVGTAIGDKLLSLGHSVVAPVRNPQQLEHKELFEVVEVSDISSVKRGDLPIEECSTVIHVAAKAHVLSKQSTNSLAEFRRVNCEATLNLARIAAEDKVKRFIFLSSIGVNGNCSKASFKHDDIPAPKEDYAISKLEAEIGLKKISEETGLEVVIIRPPLVYGKNAPGNFARFVRLAKKNFPLPLGAIHNKRSFVGLDNLVDLIVTCISHPKAANQTLLVSDDNDVSTTALLEKLIIASGQSPRLISVPLSVINFFAKIIGKKSVIDKLSNSLQVDISHTKRLLNWSPILSLDEEIKRCF